MTEYSTLDTELPEGPARADESPDTVAHHLGPVFQPTHPLALAPVRRVRGDLVRDLPATGKLLAALSFVLIVVATPAGTWWPSARRAWSTG